jgi:hypothetical protein
MTVKYKMNNRHLKNLSIEQIRDNEWIFNN